MPLHHKNIANRERMEISFHNTIMTLWSRCRGYLRVYYPSSFLYPFLCIAIGAVGVADVWFAWEFTRTLPRCRLFPPLLFAGWLEDADP